MVVSLHIKFQRTAVQAADNLRKRNAGFWMPCGGIFPVTQWFTYFVVNIQQTTSRLHIFIGRSTCQVSWTSMSPCRNLFCCRQRFHRPPHAVLSITVWWVSPCSKFKNRRCCGSAATFLIVQENVTLEWESDEFDVITVNRHVYINRIILFHALSNVRCRRGCQRDGRRRDSDD